jgi:hypothetical protein
MNSTSSFWMVPTASPSERTAPIGLESRTAKVSLNSPWVSPLTVTSIVLLFSPAAKLRVPEVAT